MRIRYEKLEVSFNYFVSYLAVDKVKVIKRATKNQLFFKRFF